MRHTLFHWRPLMGLACLAALGILCYLGRLHWIIPCIYAGMSVASLMMYGWDKRQALRNQWRTKERTLLTLDLLAGWPGGLIGQHLWKHKRNKGSYQLLFWLAAAINAAALVGLVYLWW